MDAHSRYASAAASETTGDTAKIIRGLRDHQYHLSNDNAELKAKTTALEMKMATSQQEATGTITRMQLQLDHNTAMMIKMSEDHAYDMRKMREALCKRKPR